MFYHKYLKYKTKYLQLKNQQNGGGNTPKTYYVNMGEIDKDPKIEKLILDELEKRDYVEGKEAPYNFIFVAHDAALQKNRFNTKKSTWINIVDGESKKIITNKVKLHKNFQNYDFLKKAFFIEPDTDINKLEIENKQMILKPSKGFKGYGVKIVENKKEVKDWLEKNPDYKEWLLQEYIMNPDLVNGYKFHLRVLILIIIKANKELSVYVSNRKLYVKALEKYKKGDWQNEKIHDTHFQESIKMELFNERLPDNWTNQDRDNANKEINNSIREIFKDQKDFIPEWNSKNGFEVLGADIMFENKKPIILEINSRMGWGSRKIEVIPGLMELILDNQKTDEFIRII